MSTLHPTLLTWWAMMRADAELAGHPIADGAVVLSASIGGGSCTVTAGDLDKLASDYKILLRISQQLWHNPDDAYVVERDYYAVFPEKKA